MGLRGRVAARTLDRAPDNPMAPVVAALFQTHGWAQDYGALMPELLKAPAEDQSRDVTLLVELVGEEQRDQWHRFVAAELANRLMRRRLPFTLEQLRTMTNVAVGGRRWARGDVGPAVLRAVEQAHDGPVTDPGLVALLQGARDRLEAGERTAESRKAAARLDGLLGAPAPVAPFPFPDPWSMAITQRLEQLDDPARVDARQVLDLAGRRGTSARPSQTFTRRREQLVAELGADRAGAAGAVLLRTAAHVPASADIGRTPSETGAILRGLVDVSAACPIPDAARALADYAVAGWRKVPGLGAQCRKAASAAIVALGEHPDGPSELGRVRARVRQEAAREEVAVALSAAAAALGVSPDELEEQAVPDFGLVDGAREERLGGHVARISADERGRFGLSFVAVDGGRVLRSVPAEMRRDHAERLRELKADVKDMQTMADAQRQRVERLLLDDPSWTYAEWTRRYACHGLVGPLARRLIWRVDQRSVGWRDGAWREADGTALPATPEDASVRLWHPADATLDEIQTWRLATETWHIVQPFKQAHREIYLLTEAERASRTYSNRFAAHVLRQHQLGALAAARGWSYRLQGAWDSADEDVRLWLPRHGLRVRYLVDRPWDSEEIAESGVFRYVLTDQLRFESEDGEPVALEQVPVRVLSETLRDVDLFVGVASIGNDPEWTDHGEDRRYHDYWSSYSVGELGIAALTRRDVLSRLLPKLAIADRARLEDRWLVVDGRLRTYRIHLGSGGVQMEPGRQYLCIVPGGRDGAPSKIHLPFEGDSMLSIVLSKALLLADDDRIDDPTITSQIRR